VCQERAAGDLPFVDAIGTFSGSELSVRVLREPVRCTVYTPDIGRILPVYVPDEYEGFDARTFLELTGEELDRYVESNVAAVSTLAERVRPEAALANHAVMGPVILARALAGSTPYAVKIHGSALEYTVRPAPERFLPWAREGLDPAAGVLVGSRHTAESLWSLIDDPALRARTRLGPPGVDVAAFRPLPAGEARDGLRALADRLDRPAAGWGGERGAAEALRAVAAAEGPVVTYVGKLIVSKGVDLLVAAWPLVHARLPQAALCIVGFGTYREALGEMIAALSRGDLEAVRALASAGREAEGGPRGELRHLAAFLDGMDDTARERYAASACGAAASIHLTGRLEHPDLPALLAASAAQVVPSTFPEAFGMVAAEGAACGALPVSAAHSGLAEVTATLAEALPPGLRRLLSFSLGPGAVEDLADRLISWLELAEPERRDAASRLADLARARYGWEGVAEGVLAAAAGRLGELPEPLPADRS